MLRDIQQKLDSQLALIQSAIDWSEKYGKENFCRKDFKQYRRDVKRMRRAMECRCSVAAYGESQVGKSYLMGSFLSSSDKPFSIVNQGKEYDFVNEINPSGGNMSKIESTGIITRFTTQPYPNPAMKDMVLVHNLSIIDIIMLIADSYYHDINVSPKTSLSSRDINARLQAMAQQWQSQPHSHAYITEDDIRDIQDYITDVIGNPAGKVLDSDFFDVVAANISRIGIDRWPEAFSLLWNLNANMTKLFASIIAEYKKIGFATQVYVPFTAIMRKHGTLLKIQWLDLICGQQGKPDDFPQTHTDVYGSDGSLLAQNFSKAFLSACTAEIVIVVPQEVASERDFLNHIDLLDFPGARSRLSKPEADVDYLIDMPEILRRGKVAYLFNSYVRNRKISSILFCHHNDQKSESTIGNSIKTWVEENIGATPEARAAKLRDTAGIPPLFMIATKFNIDLSRNRDDKPSSLTNHWRRFTEVIPEIIGSYQWFEEWATEGADTVPFRNIFPLRDFYWSNSTSPGMSNLFDGYCDGANGMDKSPERHYHAQEGFDGDDYFAALRESFVSNKFVQRHFSDPYAAWDEVATAQNDGSKPIIQAIDSIAGHLDSARKNAYRRELDQICRKAVNALEAHYEPSDDMAKVQKVRKVASKVRARMAMTVGANPQMFGRIIDSLMIEPEPFRKIARDILVLRTEVPRDFSGVNFMQALIGINPADGRDVNVEKLLDFFGCADTAELEEEFIQAKKQLGQDKGFSIDFGWEDVAQGQNQYCSTEAEIVAERIVGYWNQHLNNAIDALAAYLPYPDEVVKMYQNLATMLGLKNKIATKIAEYQKVFDVNECLNAIADYASLVLNNFISTVGRSYMDDNNLRQVSDRAAMCRLDVDLSPQGIEPSRSSQPLEQVLHALEQSSAILSSGPVTPAGMSVLRQLPLWDNFQRWQNLLMVGLILSSEIASGDPVANEAIKRILDAEKELATS